MKSTQILRFISKIKSAYKEMFDDKYYDKKYQERRISEITNEMLDFPIEKRLLLITKIHNNVFTKTKNELIKAIENEQQEIERAHRRSEHFKEIMDSTIN